MAAPVRAGRLPAKSSPIGTRYGSLIRLECWKARACSTPRRTMSVRRRPSRLAKTFDFLVLFTSTPGFQGDIGLAAAMKAANPKLKIAFVGPHVTTLPERSLKEGDGH